MSDCQYSEACQFLHNNVKDMPSIAEIFKQRYCISSPHTCARYQVFEELGRRHVPENLFPNQIDRVQGIITEAS